MSMSPSSTVNTRELAHNLLTGIQTRGSDASGYSFVKGQAVGTFKRAIPGSELSLGELPRRAEAVILHTRFATQGTKADNRNNHPVLSPQGNISLVHNGVISNDFEFRGQGERQFTGLPAVDSSVIPALIERFGAKDGVKDLEGYAAISWLDNRDPDSRLHLARLDYSPVAFTWLLDGSFVFASTDKILAASLAVSGLDHGHIFDMPEEQYMQVVGGVIRNSEDDVTMQEDWYTRTRYASATAGGHGTTDSYGSSYGSYSGGVTRYGIGSSFGNIDFDDDGGNPNDEDEMSYEDDIEVRNGIPYRRVSNPDGSISLHAGVGSEWDKDYRNTSRVTTDPERIAMALAMLPEKNTRQEWVENDEGELELEVVPTDADHKGFYIELEDGSIEVFATLGELEKALDNLSKLDLWDKAPFPAHSRALRWTNFVIDMGSCSEKLGQESWIEDMGHIDRFESRGVYNLQYIREGLNDLITLRAM